MEFMKGIAKRRRAAAFVAATAIVFGMAWPAAAQQPLYWGPGEDTAVVRGSVTGDQTVDYSFSAKGGTSLDVNLNSANMSLYFNIIEGNSSVAVDADPRPVEVRSWNGTIPNAGSYRIRLYLRGAARDEGKTAEFTLTVKKTKVAAGGGGGGGGGGGEDWYSVTQLDYSTGGSGEYFVDDGGGNRSISSMRVVLQQDGRARVEVNLGGDGFIIHGTWDHGDGPEIKLTITHGMARQQLKGWGTLTLRSRTEFDNVGLRFENLSQKTNHRLTFTAARG